MVRKIIILLLIKQFILIKDFYLISTCGQIQGAGHARLRIAKYHLASDLSMHMHVSVGTSKASWFATDYTHWQTI